VRLKPGAGRFAVALCTDGDFFYRLRPPATFQGDATKMSGLPFFDNEMTNQMFHLQNHVSILEKILRPIIVYVALVVLLRVFGKRELAQLNPFDLVVLLSLSNTVQNAIIGDETSITGGLVGAITLLSVNYLVVRFIFKHRRLDQLVEGSPTMLIKDGQLLEKNLAKELVTTAELQTVAHRQGFDNLDDVQTCQLEPGGTFYMEGKKAASDKDDHQELILRLDHLREQIEIIQTRLRTS
jgi:uncharacterized membrane protein YcaP (DUF421 family)